MSQKLNNHSQQNICHLNTQFKKNKQARERKKETGYILEVHFPHTFSNFVSNSRKLKFRPIIVQEPLKPTSSRQTSFTQQRLTSTICIFPGYTLKSFVKSFTSLALELWSMSSSSLRWDILATTPQVLFFMDFGVHKKQPCFCNFWQLCSTRLAWSPFSLGSPGFPSAHLTNDLQLTTVLSWAPSLEFGLNYTQQKKKLYPGNLHERRKKKKSQVLPTSSIQTGFRKKERKKKSWVKSQFSKSMTYVEFEQQGVYSCLKKHPIRDKRPLVCSLPDTGSLRCYGNHQASFSPFPQVRLCLKDAVSATELSCLKSCSICLEKSSSNGSCGPLYSLQQGRAASVSFGN